MRARRPGAGVQALLLLTMWAATCVGALVGETHALVLEQGALDRPSFASLGVDEMLAVSPLSVSLQAKPSERLNSSVSSVANISGRSVPLSLSVDGLPGLGSAVAPGSLRPGETATVRLSGKAPKRLGQYDGTIHLYGFNKYLHVTIAVRLTVTGCDDGTGPVVTPTVLPESPVVLPAESVTVVAEPSAVRASAMELNTLVLVEDPVVIPQASEAEVASQPDTGGCDNSTGDSAPLAPSTPTPVTDATVAAPPAPGTDATVPAPPAPSPDATVQSPATTGAETIVQAPPTPGTTSGPPITEVAAPPATPEADANPNPTANASGSTLPGTTASIPTNTGPPASPGGQPAPDPTPEVVPAPVIDQ